MMTTPLLQVERLRVQPPGADQPILDDVSVTIQAGERVALVGPSGAGKTTLLRALNGSVRAQSGRILFNGFSLDGRTHRDLRQVRRAMAVIPQKHDLVENLKVYHNVMAGALGRWSNLHALRFLFWQTPDEMNEAHHALQRVDLADKLRERTSVLSGGQQQRVAIARALVQKPLLILADEPVASLDPDMARQMLELLCRLAEIDNVALLCTLHQPELAREFFPRTLEMRSGRLTPEAIEKDGAGERVTADGAPSWTPGNA